MVAHVAAVLAVAGLLLAVLFHLAQRALLRRGGATPPADESLPPVSVLKPLKGVDPGLEANLESFFRLDYPAFELVLGVDDASDPALGVVRAVAARHPEVPVRLVASGRRVGANGKVNNLANILERARHDILFISDSNTAVRPEALRPMVERLLEPGVGLVTSPIRGVAGSGLGGSLETLQLNTFVMGGVAVVDLLSDQVATVGKSMLLRRTDLERIGGFAELSRYLAEDQVCGVAVRALGLGVVLAAEPVDNVLGTVSVSGFCSRHLRWARIRRRMHPAAYASEVLTNPVAFAVLALAAAPSPLTAGLLAATLGVLSLLGLRAERRLGLRRNLLHYPALELLRGILLAALWPVPFLSSTVSWRGTTYRIASRTRLVPMDGGGWAEGEELPGEAAA